MQASRLLPGCQILHAYKVCIPMPDGDSPMRVENQSNRSMVSMKNSPSQLTTKCVCMPWDGAVHVSACYTGLPPQGSCHVQQPTKTGHRLISEASNRDGELLLQDPRGAEGIILTLPGCDDEKSSRKDSPRPGLWDALSRTEKAQ